MVESQQTNQNQNDGDDNRAIDPYLEHQRSEKVLIVDENNNPVGSATRREMR